LKPRARKLSFSRGLRSRDGGREGGEVGGGMEESKIKVRDINKH